MSNKVKDEEKRKNMTAAAKQLSDMIQKRLNNRIETMNALSFTPMDNLPDEVKKCREDQAAILRAIMTEQKDIIEIIKMLFPGA